MFELLWQCEKNSCTPGLQHKLVPIHPALHIQQQSLQHVVGVIWKCASSLILIIECRINGFAQAWKNMGMFVSDNCKDLPWKKYTDRISLNGNLKF